jgi:hypothetical protein
LKNGVIEAVGDGECPLAQLEGAVRVTPLPPSYLLTLAEAALAKGIDSGHLSLRYAVLGAEPCRTPLA